MEQYFRALLYKQLEGRPVTYNPIEPEPFDLVDLTRDVTNSTRIYHRRTECVREALEGASLIIADSQPLANVVKRILPRAMVAALPFGPFYAAIESNSDDRREARRGQVPIVGLLNHSSEMEMNNRYALKLLKSLDRPLMVYGQALRGIEGDAIAKENFDEFAALCDILLLPSMPGVINSTTLPLTLMAGKTAVLAHNAPGYYDLSAASGVQLLPNEIKAWQDRLTNLIAQPAKLRAMQERNKAYATRLNRESHARLLVLAHQFVASASPLSEDCGCAKRMRSVTHLPPVVHGGGNTRRGAPPNPIKINPI